MGYRILFLNSHRLNESRKTGFGDIFPHVSGSIGALVAKILRKYRRYFAQILSDFLDRNFISILRTFPIIIIELDLCNFLDFPITPLVELNNYNLENIKNINFEPVVVYFCSKLAMVKKLPLLFSSEIHFVLNTALKKIK